MEFRTKEGIMGSMKYDQDDNSWRIVEVLIDIRDILAAELSLKINPEPHVAHSTLCPYCKEPGINISTFDDRKYQYLCCNKDCGHPNSKWEGEERGDEEINHREWERKKKEKKDRRRGNEV